MNSVLAIANSPLMWLSCSLGILIVLWQTFLFARKSWRTGEELGMSTETMKEAMKASAITSIGPSVAVGTGVLALLVIIGSPMAWYRLSFVGSLLYETLSATLAVAACGLEMGVDTFGGTEFATICWVMIIGAFGFTIVATFVSPAVGKLQQKIAGDNMKLMGVISTCALMATIGAVSSQYLVSISPNLVSVLVGGAAMVVFIIIAEKKNILWLKEWSLFFSMTIGMIFAACVA